MEGNFFVPGHAFFQCDLGKVAGVQQECTKAATVHAVVVSPSRYVNGQAWCGGSYWAECFSYEPLENFVAVTPPSGACQGESPGAFNVLDTVVTGQPWWNARAPKTHVGCGGRSYEASVSPTGGAVNGVFTVTCTFV
jgi:hypothetical protein